MHKNSSAEIETAEKTAVISGIFFRLQNLCKAVADAAARAIHAA